MKKSVIIFFLVVTSSYCQKLEFGIYESKEGSILKLLNNHSFYYKRSKVKIDSDIISLWNDYESYGNFKYNEGLIYLCSDELKLESQIERGIIFNLNEIEKELKPGLELENKIIVNYNKELISVYLCNTGIEIDSNYDDISNCFKLDKVTKTKNAFEKFFIRIYPNLNNYETRGLHTFKTLYFDSKKISKKMENDIEIDISFEMKNFDLVYFNNELMNFKNGKIFHEGQEFILKK